MERTTTSRSLSLSETWRNNFQLSAGRPPIISEPGEDGEGGGAHECVSSHTLCRARLRASSPPIEKIVRTLLRHWWVLGRTSSRLNAYVWQYTPLIGKQHIGFLLPFGVLESPWRMPVKTFRARHSTAHAFLLVVQLCGRSVVDAYRTVNPGHNLNGRTFVFVTSYTQQRIAGARETSYHSFATAAE